MTLVPTLCVGTHPVTLCVTTPKVDAERPGLHSHAERGNDQRSGGTISAQRPLLRSALRIEICVFSVQKSYSTPTRNKPPVSK